VTTKQENHPHNAQLKNQQNKLKNSGFRTIVDDKADKIGSKIRNTEIAKIPIMLILGEKEAKNNTVSIRRRFIGDEGELSIDKLVENVSLEIKKRSLPYRKNE
jgi:threonyl-tRNA synthetase